MDYDDLPQPTPTRWTTDGCKLYGFPLHNVGLDVKIDVQALNYSITDAKKHELVKILWHDLAPSISCIVCNLLVMVAIARGHRSHRSRPYMFLFSVCCADLVTTPFIGLNMILTLSNLPHWPAIARLMCPLTHFLENGGMTIVAWNLTAVSIERYIVICYPLKAKYYWTRGKCRGVIFLTWLIGATIGILSAYLNKYGGCGYSYSPVMKTLSMFSMCTADGIGGIILAFVRLVVVFFIPFCIMLFCYTNIIARLYKSEALDSMRHPGQMTLVDIEPPRSQSRSSSVPNHVDVSEQRNLFARQGRVASLHSYLSSTNFGGSILSFISGTGGFTDGSETNSVTPGGLRLQAQEIRRTRKKLIRLLIAVVVVFTFCYLPRFAVQARAAVIEDQMPEISFSNSTSDTESFYYGYWFRMQLEEVVTALFVYHSTFSPLMYLLFSKEMRRSIVPNCCCKKREVRLPTNDPPALLMAMSPHLAARVATNNRERPSSLRRHTLTLEAHVEEESPKPQKRSSVL